MADEAFDPVQAGAVAVQEPAQFDPVSAGAVPVKDEEPSFLQKAGRALVQGVEKILPSFKEAYPQATLEQALIPFPIQQAQQGIQLGQEAYQATQEPLGSQKQLNAIADVGLAFAPLLLPELPRVFKGFRPSLVETFHGVSETLTPVADAAEAAQVASETAPPVISEAPAATQAPAEPFPSILQSAEEQRRIAPQEAVQQQGGEIPSATQEGQVPESNIPEYPGNGEGRPSTETGGGGGAVPGAQGQEAVAPITEAQPAAEIPPSSAVAEPVAAKPTEVTPTTETTGIAERYREEQQPGSVIPGTGVTSEQAKAYGQDFINKGNDPYMAVRRAQAGNTSWRDVGVARAEYDRLGNEKRVAENALDKDPNNMQLQEAFNKADDAQRKWSKDAQPILTRAGDALRAATRSYPREINSFSDFTDIANDHFNGEVELTPDKRAELQKAVRAIKTVNQDATNARAQVTDSAIQKAGGRTMSFNDLKSDLNGAVEKLLEDCPV